VKQIEQWLIPIIIFPTRTSFSLVVVGVPCQNLKAFCESKSQKLKIVKSFLLYKLLSIACTVHLNFNSIRKVKAFLSQAFTSFGVWVLLNSFEIINHYHSDFTPVGANNWSYVIEVAYTIFVTQKKFQIFS